MGGKIRLTDAEKQWSLDAIAKLDGHISVKKITELKMPEECVRLFGRIIGASGLYTRLRVMAISGGTYVKKGKDKKPEQVFEKSQYLVYVQGMGVSGFETEEEVKSFLEKSKILGNVRLFKFVPVTLKYEVQIGV